LTFNGLCSMALLVVSVLTLGFSFLPSPALASSRRIGSPQEDTIGRIPTDFTLPDADGKEHTLSDYKGKFVVLEWVNFGCPFVRKHYESHNMQKLQEAYTNKGVVWLTICSSERGKQGYMTGGALKNKIKEMGWKGTAYLVDEDGKVCDDYAAETTPDMFILDKSGVLVYAGAIDSVPTTSKFDVDDAKNYVKVALDEIMAGKKVGLASTKPYGSSVLRKIAPFHN